MDTSIIILSHEHPQVTLSCLRSIFDAGGLEGTEIILFDNSSSPKNLTILARELKSHFPSVTLVLSDKNLGFAKGLNRAVKEANNSTLVFLNNDIVVQGEWLQPMLCALEEVNVGVAGSVLLYPDGTIQHAGIGAGLWGLPVNLMVGMPVESLPEDDLIMALGTTGACFAVTRDFFDSLGGFDENYFFRYEDIDFCLRALKKGMKTVTINQTKIIHHECFTIGNKRELNPLMVEAEEFFLDRWQEIFKRFAREKINGLITDNIREIAVYGTGKAAEHLEIMLREIPEVTIKYFLDSHESILKACLSGKPVYELNRPAESVDAIVIASMFGNIILNSIQQYRPNDKSLFLTYNSIPASYFD